MILPVIHRQMSLSLSILLAGFMGFTLCIAKDLSAEYHKEILPILENSCYDCHGDGVKKGELALDDYKTISEMIANREVWKRVREHIDFRLMPPPEETPPTPQDRQKLLKWIDEAVFPVDLQNPDPGHVTLRRLNKSEYQNTIRDLLGVELHISEILPEDDTGYGFDTIGDVLTLSPVHLERYYDAAQLALNKAITLGPMPRHGITVKAEKMEGDGYMGNQTRVLAMVGEAFYPFPVTRDGKYRVEVTASGDWAKGIAPLAELKVMDKLVTQWEVTSKSDLPKVYSQELILKKQESVKISVAFTNDAWDPDTTDLTQRDRNLTLHQISLVGPLDGPEPDKPKSHADIYGSRPAGMSDAPYFHDVLSRFAKRAYRRPVTAAEMKPFETFLTLAKSNGESVDSAIREALGAMLVSPSFLFREEPMKSGSAGGKQLINDYALASRLSYFLWSSMPDEELFALASTGKLRGNLLQTINRMLSSSKSEAFVKNFVGQWLQLRDVTKLTPNPKVFTNFNSKIATDMCTETEMLITHILRNEQPIITLLDADYTFLNERLAKFYKIPDVQGSDFRKVSLQGTSRRGLLNHGSFLTLTSYPNRTSPVQRGKYVLENILDTPPPPPPPNVPQIATDHKDPNAPSLREQMERHRDDPACSSCHALMDPIGFALEHYDGTGAWRDSDNNKPINPAGTLVTGRAFVDAEELRKIIVQDHRAEFHRAVATKMLTYAIGRGMDWYDRPSIDGIVQRASAKQVTFTSLIEAVVYSVPFQYSR